MSQLNAVAILIYLVASIRIYLPVENSRTSQQPCPQVSPAPLPASCSSENIGESSRLGCVGYGVMMIVYFEHLPVEMSYEMD